MLISIGGASAIFTWAPVAAPLFASQLAESFGWRSVYFAMAAYGGLGATCVLLTPSQRLSSGRFNLALSIPTRSVAMLVRDSQSRAGLLVGSLSFWMLFRLCICCWRGNAKRNDTCNETIG